jgi:hypothetical protein
MNFPLLGIGFEVDAAGIGISASCISVRYRSIPVPDWVTSFWYRTGSGIGIFCYSASGGLTGYRTVWKRGTYTRHIHTASDGLVYSIHPAHSHCWWLERNTPCTTILLAVEMDTPCMSILLAVERDIQFIHIHPARSYCWLWKWIHPARPYC